ncbi:MAG: hypothetical protein JSS87_05825 [Acidobacteria bacterium]|nr:hypothetical protein [Acidobacteriota bacterium]
MERILHSLTTLWIYARRNKYMDVLTVEDANLARRERETENSDLLQQIRQRRTTIAEELRDLSAPLSWRSLFSSEKSGDHASGVPMMSAVGRAQDDFIQAA